MADDEVGYDAAYPPIAAELAKHPIVVAAYTDGTHAYSTAQVAQLRTAQAAVLPNHENAANQLLGGEPAGRKAATDAVAAVLAWGAPANNTMAICYSVDVELLTQAEIDAVAAAFDGINAVHAGRFKASVYGQGSLIDFLAAHGKTQAKGWLSASKSYPGFNPNSPNVGAVQLVGTDVPGTDKNTILDASGLWPWWPQGHVPTGDTVSLTDSQIAADAELGAREYGASAEAQGRILADLAKAGVPATLAAISAAVTNMGGRVAALQAATAAHAPATPLAVDPATLQAAVAAELPGALRTVLAELAITVGPKA